MRPIPLELREQIAKDPFMKKCIYAGCPREPEWEHAWIYAGKQINEWWAIVPVCAYHHRGKGLDKAYNQYRSIIRIDISEIIKKYPNKDWLRINNYLNRKYGQIKTNIIDGGEKTSL